MTRGGEERAGIVGLMTRGAEEWAGTVGFMTWYRLGRCQYNVTG